MSITYFCGALAAPSKAAWRQTLLSLSFMICALLSAHAFAAPDAALAKAKKLGPLQGTCTCSVTCTSDEGQQTTRSYTEGTFYGPFTGAKRFECKDRCQQRMDGLTSAWSKEGKLCKRGNCDGQSQLAATASIPLDAVSFDNSREPFCNTVLPGACCPPTSQASVSDLFDFFKVPDNTKTNYLVYYRPNAVLDAQMNAFATLAGLMQAGCNPSVVTYTLSNANTQAVLSTMTVSYNGSSAPVVSPPGGFGPVWLSVNTPYKVVSSGGCKGYTAADCKSGGFGFQVVVTPLRVAPGSPSAEQSAGQVRIQEEGVQTTRDLLPDGAPQRQR